MLRKVRELAGSEPDARASRRSPRHHVPGNLRNADSGDPGSCNAVRRRRRRCATGNHGSAGHYGAGNRACQSNDRRDRSAKLEKEHGKKLEFKFGTMIETVRACTRAWHLADIVEFFSFGTNDLTQATFSFSREDAENKFLPMYNESGILQDNPFEVLDTEGCWQADQDGRQERSRTASGSEDRHLRRAGRSSRSRSSSATMLV